MSSAGSSGPGRDDPGAEGEAEPYGNAGLGAAQFSTIGLALSLVAGACAPVDLKDLRVPESVPSDSCVVLGFLGGRDARDDESKGVRQLALRLRNTEPHLYTETFANRQRHLAEAFLLRALDRNREGRIDPSESRTLVIYGQSFGGAATVKFAWRLARLLVPVYLTIQIDSVGSGDDRIPPNVAYAANLYQDDGWIIQGENPIRAIDRSQTQILGNWRFDYGTAPGSEISLGGVSWWKRFMRVAHAKMDGDPRVWSLVERLIRSACRRDRAALLEAG